MTEARWLRPTAQKRALEELPTPEVRGGNRERKPATAQEWSRGATPHPRSGAVAARSYPTHEVKGGSQEEQPHVQGAAAALCWSSHEEIPNIQVRR